MTTLTPMLQFIQDKILLAVHPGCSIEEARMEEVKNKGCILELKTYYKKSKRWITSIGEVVNKKRFMCSKSRDKETIGIRDISFNWETVEKIIGLPPTLSRVLTALGIEFYFWNGIRHAEKISNNYENRKYICDRKLLNEDNTDASLFDQSEETQKSIALLLGWNDEDN